jgi:hypothetical protein
LWIALLHLSHIRQKSDLKAASMIGADVQEAYNFGQIGLVVCDERGTVMWDNNLFKERNIDLLDENILDWQPKLRELQDAPSDMVVKIEANGITIGQVSQRSSPLHLQGFDRIRTDLQLFSSARHGLRHHHAR